MYVQQRCFACEDITMIPDSYLNIQIMIIQSRENQGRSCIYPPFVWACVCGLCLCTGNPLYRACVPRYCLSPLCGSTDFGRPRRPLGRVWRFQKPPIVKSIIFHQPGVYRCGYGTAGSGTSVCTATPLCMWQDITILPDSYLNIQIVIVQSRDNQDRSSIHP